MRQLGSELNTTEQHLQAKRGRGLWRWPAVSHKSRVSSGLVALAALHSTESEDTETVAWASEQVPAVPAPGEHQKAG